MDHSLADLRQCLESTDQEIRLAATRQLSALDPLPISLLTLCLADTEWRVRKEAIRLFCSSPAPLGHIDDIIALLSDSESAAARSSAIEILTGFGASAVDPVLQALETADAEVRKFLIDILGEIGEKHCAERIVALLDDTDENVRYAAVETLGKLEVEQAIEPLLAMMGTADSGLRFTILEALAAIGAEVPSEQLTPYLNDPLLRKSVYACFAFGGAGVLPALVMGLVDPQRQVRSQVLDILGRFTSSCAAEIRRCLNACPQAIETLRQALADGSIENRRAAIRLFPLIEGADFLCFLPQLQEEQLREDVVDAFRILGDVILADLVAGAQSGDDENGLYLTFLSGELGCSAGVPLAISGLNSEDPCWRYAAAVALGKLADEGAILALIPCLDDEVEDVRAAATSSLGLLGQSFPDQVLEIVIQRLQASEVAARVTAVQILALLTADMTSVPLHMTLKDSAAEVRCEAVLALSHCPADVRFESLRSAFTDEDSTVRRLAVEALCGVDGQYSRPVLLLAAEDSDPWVRATALRVLWGGADHVAKKTLYDALSDPVGFVVIAALEALLFLGDCDVACIARVLDHPDEAVVLECLDLLKTDSACFDWAAAAPGLLGHQNAAVRLYCVRALVAEGCSVADDILMSCLEAETDPRVQQALADLQRLFLMGRD